MQDLISGNFHRFPSGYSSSFSRIHPYAICVSVLLSMSEPCLISIGFFIIGQNANPTEDVSWSLATTENFLSQISFASFLSTYLHCHTSHCPYCNLFLPLCFKWSWQQHESLSSWPWYILCLAHHSWCLFLTIKYF